MGRIYITGDCHADFHKFATDKFPQQKELSHEDFVIICGDFGGVWADSDAERYWLNWLNRKNFTTLFVDGNHENFDRLNGGEFPTIDFYGGKAHKIRKNIYHLQRGEIYNIYNRKIFAFGGAKSHDIKDGILRLEQFSNMSTLLRTYNKLSKAGWLVRIDHLSWWDEEMPSKSEMTKGIENLEKCGNKVDFIVSHCCPQRIVDILSSGEYKPDDLTRYFDKIANTVEFSKWFFGHYHKDCVLEEKFIMNYNNITRIV